MNDGAKDQQRLVISLGIVAAAVGVYTIPSGDNVALALLRTAITIQAVLAFLYILYLASSLKYSGSGSLFDITIPRKLGILFYDHSIEMFLATIYSGTLFSAYIMLPGEWREGWRLVCLIALISVITLIIPLTKLAIAITRKAKK